MTASHSQPALGWSDAAAAAERMAAAAIAFLDALDAGQVRQALSPFNSPARPDWHYVPRQRPGLPLRAMGERQRRAAWALLDAALSAEGVAKVRGVLALEEILQRGTLNKAYRDPENYALALFGRPGPSPWAWRFEGHHVSLTLTIIPEIGLAVTPSFFGANPFSGRVVPGPHGGLAGVLERQSDLAFEIVNGLAEPSFRRALIDVASPADIVTGPGRERALREPAGLPLDAMPPPLQQRALALLESFFAHLAPELAEAQARHLREAGAGGLCFAWAGATTPDRLHYFRLHGQTLIVEYDRTDRDHAHAVWHDPTNLFGEDHLRRHHAAAHGRP